MTDPSPELLNKYFRDQCTAEERLLVEAWLTKDEALIPDLPLEVEPDTGERVWEALKNRRLAASKKPSSSRFISLCLRSAAAVLLLLGAFFFWQSRGKHTPENIAIEFQTVKTPLGRKAKFRLPDNTLVYLNSGSEMRFPKQFSDKNRTVELKGEAFLAVTKDASRPFVVQTQDLDVKVLGTRFNVKSYDSDPQKTVTVEEGKVRVSIPNETKTAVILLPNEAAEWTPSKSLEKKYVQTNSNIGWKDNRMMFDNQKLSEVAIVLERWYGVKIEIKSGELENYRYTASFTNPALEDFLRNMSFVVKCRYTIHNQNVTIY